MASGHTPTGYVTSIAVCYVACADKIVERSLGGTRRDEDNEDGFKIAVARFVAVLVDQAL